MVLARVLAARPSVLLADEPAADLPACHAHGAIALLRAAARSDGIAVVLATRDATAARLADHVVRLG